MSRLINAFRSPAARIQGDAIIENCMAKRQRVTREELQVLFAAELGFGGRRARAC